MSEVLRNRIFQAGLVTLLMLAMTEVAFRAVPGLSLMDQRLNDFLLVNIVDTATLDAPGSPVRSDIAIVTFTETTLASLPYRSPLDRAFLAGLLDGLAAVNVRSVGFDILFDQATEPAKDQQLIDAIRRFPGPVIVAWADARAGLIEAQSAWLEDFIARSGAIPGFANVTIDRDGLVRHYDLTLPGTDNQSLAGAMLRANGFELPEAKSGLISWRTPPDGGAQAYPVLPSQGVLAISRIRPAALKPALEGKLVLVGADLPQQDRHRTSLSASLNPNIPRLTAGVEIHANIIDQVINKRHVPEAGVAVRWLIILTIALIGAALGVLEMPLPLRLAGMLGLMGTYAGLVWLSAMEAWPLLPATRPLAVLVLSFAASTSLNAYLARKDGQFIRGAFSQYLAPALVDELTRHPERLKVGGERKEMSFLFSDIAGFTNLSERLTPERLSSLLNGYLDGMSEIVLRNGGTIDKFIGDAVVALFGAPAAMPDHAHRAITCATEMDAFTESYRLANSDVTMGITRIGVHSGEAIVGNFGGVNRFDYTAMGDAMNIAARLEAANKHFGTRLAISASSVERAGLMQDSRIVDVGGSPVLPIGNVILKGKKQPVTIYTCLKRDDKTLAERYRAAYSALDDDVTVSSHMLDSILVDDPEHPLATLHAGRLRAGETGSTFELLEK
ncbi:MAG: adenylate/guanylate cyclase domain-containing protein [Minwuia sp.]|nr:adenylate/guanylate cyclase domain-containing protein [Minwuia sp.]